MAIIETVTQESFIAAFRRMDRMDGWTENGLRALYSYLENLSDDLGEPIALDVDGLCRKYNEYASAAAAAKEYGLGALDWFRCRRIAVIEFDGGVIVQSF